MDHQHSTTPETSVEAAGDVADAMERDDVIENESDEGAGDARAPDDVSRSMNAIRGIVRALRINTRAIEQKMGISLAQLFVLQQLADRPAHSLNDLADRTATHQSSVSVVVRRLVERGLVSRTASARDRRRIKIALTPEGQRKLEGAPPTIQLQLIAGLRQFSDSERRMLADLMERLLVAAGIPVASPEPMMLEEDPEMRAGSV